MSSLDKIAADLALVHRMHAAAGAAFPRTTPRAIEHLARKRRALRIRLTLAFLAHAAVAFVVVGVLYALIVLLWLAFGGTPGDYDVQLPTL